MSIAPIPITCQRCAGRVQVVEIVAAESRYFVRCARLDCALSRQTRNHARREKAIADWNDQQTQIACAAGFWLCTDGTRVPFQEITP